MFEGVGEYRYLSGDIYRGAFSKDRFHGIGTMFYKDGTMEKGKFYNDQRVGKFYCKESEFYSEVIYQNDTTQKTREVIESDIPLEKRPIV